MAAAAGELGRSAQLVARTFHMSHISRRDVLRLVGAGIAGAATPSATPAQQQKKPGRKYLILACDGGGVRGALTARIVQRIEEELKAATQAKILLRDRVDCFAGTSTGGIIALGLACGKTPEELVGLYKDKAEHLFNAYTAPEMKPLESVIYATVTSSLKTLDKTLAKALDTACKLLKLPRSEAPHPGWSAESDQLFFVRYDSTAVREVLAAAFGEKQKQPLAKVARAVLVTTFLLGKPGQAWRPVILHNMPRKDTDDAASDLDTRMVGETTVLDAALCTSAAPTYFAPHKHPELGYCADGGVFANNPGVAALSRARRAGQQVDDIRIVSVGTGSVTNYMKVPPWNFADKESGGMRCGLLAWLLPRGHDGVPATPLITAMFDAGAAADETYCKGILGDDGYRRIQVRLKKDIDLDDTKAIPELIDLADKYFEGDTWKEDKEWLRKIIAD
jgi:patatin-like phospholipase/acyl hydrolase